MNKAVFSLEDFQFNKVNVNFEKNVSEELEIRFSPMGQYDEATGSFKLLFVFDAIASGEAIINVQCVGSFLFENRPTLDEIPSYFYRNSIAILFPYVRAFVTFITIQANVRPLILPTMNLSELEEPLRQNTVKI